MTYEELLEEAANNNLKVLELPLEGHDGRNKGNRIAIRKDISTKIEKKCVLAEELGHYNTSVGDILNQDIEVNRKQELKARDWAYDKLIGILGIISAFNAGCTNLFEMAEYLCVSEEFLKEALKRYECKYGVFTTIDNYIIYFVPSLAIIKLF